MNFSLGASKIITPGEMIENAFICIEDDKIKEIGKSKPENLLIQDKIIVYPGLINSHDHLIGAYYPKAGKGPYLNWLPWDNDLKKAKVYEERGKIANSDLYYISCYRHLVSGVVTVSDHIPHFLCDQFIPKMPIRVIENFTLAHECSSYDLKWGSGIENEYQKAAKNNWPFITHINEGWDNEAKNGVNYLIEKNALTENTVLIHGLSYSMEDIRNIARHNANHVWCPISNYYMFEKVAKVKEMRELGVNVAIGTDSPMSGGVNLLEEMRFGKRIYKEIYSEELEDKTLFEMATINGARAFKIDHYTGTLEPGKIADMLVLKDIGTDPYSALVQAKLEDILLVVYKGEPVYADETFESLFKTLKISFKRVNINKAKKLVKYGENYPDINEIMNRIKANVGYEKRLPFVPIS